MAKRIGFNPLIFLGDNPGDDNVIGGGTGQSTTNPHPCSYSDWLILFSDDYDSDGTEGTQSDYMQWWYDNEFSIEAWKAYNGDTPFRPPYSD